MKNKTSEYKPFNQGDEKVLDALINYVDKFESFVFTTFNYHLFKITQ